jgi:Mce-associated membrane protein
VISSFSVHDPERPDADATDDEVAKAEARAEAARTRLSRLREAAKTGDAASEDQGPAQSTRPRPRLPRRPGRPPWLRRPGRPRWLRRPGRKAVAAALGILLTSASLGASGYMIWQHRTATHNRQLAAEFAAAARQNVTMLMSLDAQHAKEDIQRVIDACTGDLKLQLEATSSLMAEKAQESKASSKATVEAVGVESMSDNSAVVLVAAKTDVTNPDNTNRPPVVWRISVDLLRDGGQLKMSKVDFLQ